MNKAQMILIITLLHAQIFTGVHLLSIFDKQNQQTHQLSANQIFELNYLQEKLEETREELLQDWTKNEDIRILIERTELAIDQSSPKTQLLMKQRVINIFKKLGINIILTPDNSIQLVSLDHPEQVTLLSEYDDGQTTAKHKITKKKRPRNMTTTPAKVQPLQKIKGANRTRKRLEREWKQRHEAARRAEMIQRAQKSALKAQRNSKEFNQTELLKKDIEQLFKSDQTEQQQENSTDLQHLVQETI